MGILLLNSGTDHLLSEESLSSQDHFTGFYDSRFQTIKFASQRSVEQKGVGKVLESCLWTGPWDSII